MQIAGIARLYYAADLATANSALCDLPDSARFPIDSGRVQEECGRSIGERSMPSEQALSVEAAWVIATWAKKARSAREP
jgi:hypothetical protein